MPKSESLAAALYIRLLLLPLSLYLSLLFHPPMPQSHTWMFWHNFLLLCRHSMLLEVLGSPAAQPARPCHWLPAGPGLIKLINDDLDDDRFAGRVQWIPKQKDGTTLKLR